MTNETEWQDIDTAPKDGTVVRVRNRLTMGMKITARYGPYTSPLGTQSMQWTVVRDFDPFMPVPSGTLTCPTEWAALREAGHE
jgi:hypothetical protein